MTRAATRNFRNVDGSVNVERAILAGHEARTEALRGFMKSTRQMVKMHMKVVAKRFVVTNRKDLPSFRG